MDLLEHFKLSHPLSRLLNLQILEQLKVFDVVVLEVGLDVVRVANQFDVGLELIEAFVASELINELVDPQVLVSFELVNDVVE